MSDVTHGTLAIVPPPGPNMYNPITAQDLAPGMPVCPSVSLDLQGQVVRAQADDSDHTFAVGLAAAQGVTAHNVHIQFGGPLSLTTAQWDHLTGETGGLENGAPYYLSAAEAGKLTKIGPVSPNYLLQLGVAHSPTTLMINIGIPIAQGS